MKNKLIQLLLIVIFLSLIINPSLITNSIYESINIFYKVLFPSIFPFFLISNLLISYNFQNTLHKIFGKLNNYLFHTSNSSNFVILMSMISGFPSGSKYIKQLLDKNLLDINKANYLITFTHFANPLFVLNLSRRYFNTNISYLILFSHIISNIIIGIIIRPKEKEVEKPILNSNIPSFSEALSYSIKSSFDLILIILGNTCLFFYISALIEYYLKLKGLDLVLINGFLDITKGINSINTLNTNILIKCFLLLNFLSFGGINIHMQVLNIIKESKIKYKNFLYGRISQCSISIIVFYIIYNLLY